VSTNYTLSNSVTDIMKGRCTDTRKRAGCTA